MELFNQIKKSIKDYNDHSFSIKRFAVLFQKLNLYIIGICLLFPAIWYNYFDNNYINKRNLVFSYEKKIKEQFQSLSADYSELKQNGNTPYSDLGTYEDFYNEQVPRFYSDFRFIYGSMAVTALPWLLILFWPAGAPIRVDRKNGLIYTRQWFRFYAARLDQIQPECKDFSASLERVGGPLIISLYRPGKVYNKNKKLNRGMRIRLGYYIPVEMTQNRDILRHIQKFMRNDIDIPNSFKPQKGWLEWSLVPDHKLAKQTKLDKQIQHWFNKENKPIA